MASCVRVIQGDGVNPESIRQILQNLKDKGWSAENIAFGMGGALLQKGVDRDTMKWAMKANATKRAGDPAWHDVFKDPVTDQGKRSKTGVQALVKDGDAFTSIRRDQLGAGQTNLLQLVWEIGELQRDQNLAPNPGRLSEEF